MTEAQGPITALTAQNLSQGTVNFLEGDLGLLIDGEAVPGMRGAGIDVIDPGTGAQICVVAEGQAEDIASAVGAARAAQDGHWGSTSPSKRERLLNQLADLIEANAIEIAQLEVLDTGKPLRNARAEVGLAVATYRYYAGWPTKVHGETNPTASSLFSYTVREPVGVCGQITAWNYPFLLASWKVAPALAFGNTVVLKPPELTPLSSLRLGQLCIEAGFPPGVVNVVPGYGTTAGAALVEHPGVDKIAFTGSTEVGKQIVIAGAQTMKRVTLELGGKSPNIVLADADLEAAANGALRGIFWNSGQVCVAGSRLLVERRIADAFVATLVEKTDALKLGHGLTEGIDMGPMVSKAHQSRVLGMIDAGRVEGASVEIGGTVGASEGFFVEPTIFTGVTNSMRIAQEEIFGPVLSVISFDDLSEVTRLANETRFGLAAAIWTRDVTKAHELAKSVKAGTVWVNTFGALEPAVSFGGYKESGVGRELGPHSVDAYTEVKSVYVGLA